jgi:acyl dehydratase
MRIISGVDALQSLVGHEAGCSDWIRIEQQRIDAFAEATGDRQWIHVDVERAARESPYRTTIAHGYLTLSLLPMLFQATLRIDGLRMLVNYGLDRVRFPAPVRVDSRLRARFTLAALTPIDGSVQLQWDVAIECEGLARPVCVAATLMRGYV